MSGIRIGAPVQASVLLVAMFLSTSAWAVDAIPTTYGRDRYEETRVRSPFAPATVVAKTTDEKKPPIIICSFPASLNDCELEVLRTLWANRSMKFTGDGPGERDQKAVRDR
jgi:hypothetical protein